MSGSVVPTRMQKFWRGCAEKKREMLRNIAYDGQNSYKNGLTRFNKDNLKKVILSIFSKVSFCDINLFWML